MAKRPARSDPGSVPAPDRTRVEVSPFAEEGAGVSSDTSPLEKHEAPRPSPSPGSGRSTARRNTMQPSIIVDDALDAQSEPASRKPSATRSSKAAQRSAPEEEEEWDEPPAVEDSQATRIGAPPPSRHASRSDDNATSAGPPISVECVVGPDRGTRLPIRGGRMIVGRGDGCDFKLSDTSVSRRHLELTAGPGGVVLRDLGSGNGTRVNGKKEVEVDVDHGDQISLGETVLKVVDEVKRADEERAKARPPPRAAPPPRRSLPARRVLAEDDEPDPKEATGVVEIVPRRHLPPPDPVGPLQKFQRLPLQFKLMGGVVAGLVLLVIIGIIANAGTKPVAPRDDPKVKNERAYELAFQEARRLFVDNKHKEALEKAQEAQALLSTPQVERLISSCELTIKSKGTLTDARAAAARGDYESAVEKAKTIEADSSLYDEAKELIKKWEDQKISAALEKVRAAANDGDLEGARTLLAALPLDRQEAMRRELVELERQYKADSASRQRNAAIAAQRARANKVKRQRQEIDDAIAPVVRKIDSGDFEGAVRQCDRVAEASRSDLVAQKVKLLKKTIPLFGRAYTAGVSSYNGGSYDQAAGSLLRALKLYEDMDIEGKLDQGLKDKAGQSLAFKGRSAARRQEYGVAAKAFKEALRLNPNSKEAIEGLKTIRRSAEEVYQEAYAVQGRDPDAARRRYRDVVEMVPAGDELAKKAQKRLDDLEGR